MHISKVKTKFNTAHIKHHRYVYWGEYPLAFAACLGQEECYRLMLARGANPNNQDTNGNTVLHMLVIYEKLVSIYICSTAVTSSDINYNIVCIASEVSLFYLVLPNISKT